MTAFLSAEDYEESPCPLCRPGKTERIPMGRVIEKLDSYLDKKDFDAAERHLAYWLAEAESIGDSHGLLTILNEQIGFYRKQNNEAACMQAIDNAEKLLKQEDLFGAVTVGTTLINMATGYKAFGKNSEALSLYDRAQALYEEKLDGSDERMAGLYNNKALALKDVGEFNKAQSLFEKALFILEQNENTEPDRAITYCNLADLSAARDGMLDAETEIFSYLEKAEDLLNSVAVRNGYYAFVCEKCAPAFDYFGFFTFARELNERARNYYDRT